MKQAMPRNRESMLETHLRGTHRCLVSCSAASGMCIVYDVAIVVTVAPRRGIIFALSTVPTIAQLSGIGLASTNMGNLNRSRWANICVPRDFHLCCCLVKSIFNAHILYVDTA